MRVVIVDDSPTMRRIMGNCLAQLGDLEIFEAGDGREGLDLLERIGPVDLVLADWRMPELDGLELAKAVSRSETLGRTPVVLVTVESEKAKVVEALRAGARGYVVKPFTPDILLRKVSRVLDEARGEGSGRE
ncbi:MAG: response regulator [Planctomycetes bacterium]|nr:response regulator [Planctomycetota bacterium]